jgi:hypothetical protein
MIHSQSDGRAHPFSTPTLDSYREAYRFLTTGRGLRGFYTGNFYYLLSILTV